jgi:hypothetical protein
MSENTFKTQVPIESLSSTILQKWSTYYPLSEWNREGAQVWKLPTLAWTFLPTWVQKLLRETDPCFEVAIHMPDRKATIGLACPRVKSHRWQNLWDFQRLPLEFQWHRWKAKGSLQEIFSDVTRSLRHLWFFLLGHGRPILLAALAWPQAWNRTQMMLPLFHRCPGFVVIKAIVGLLRVNEV